MVDHKGWENWISVLFCDKEFVPAQTGVLLETYEMEDGEFYELLFNDGSKIVVEKKWTQLSLSYKGHSEAAPVELVRVEE